MQYLYAVAATLMLAGCTTEPEACPVHPIEVRRDSIARAVPDSLLPQVWVGLCAGPAARQSATLRLVVRF